MKEAKAGTQPGTWRQEVKQRSYRNTTAGLLLMAGLLSLLSYTTQDHLPRGNITQGGLDYPCNSPSKKMPHKLAYGKSDGGVSSFDSPLPR